MKTRAKAGFTLLEIMIVVTIIGFLVGLAVPALIKTRLKTQKTQCIDNLRQIANYKDIWAMETFSAAGAAVQGTDIEPFFNRGLPDCPGGGGPYNIGVVGDPPGCPLPADMGHVLD